MKDNITVGISMPPDLKKASDKRVEELDTDRSKYFRNLVRRDLEKTAKEPKPKKKKK